VFLDKLRCEYHSEIARLKDIIKKFRPNFLEKNDIRLITQLEKSVNDYNYLDFNKIYDTIKNKPKFKELIKEIAENKIFELKQDNNIIIKINKRIKQLKKHKLI